MTMLNKCKLWKRPDGTVRITYFIKEAMRPGQSEDGFIAESTDKLKSKNPVFNSYLEIDATRTMINSVITKRSDRDKLRLKPNNELWVDPSVETRQERSEALRQSARAKLKTGAPLTDAEIDKIIR